MTSGIQLTRPSQHTHTHRCILIISYTCIHIHTYTHIYTYTLIYMPAHTHTFIHIITKKTRIHTHIHSLTCAYTHTHLRPLTAFTHLIMEGMYISMKRHLSDKHPIHRLLAPHFNDLIAINALVYHRCMGGDKDFAKQRWFTPYLSYVIILI